MKTILTRLFTAVMLMMVSMGARADVKILYGEKGTEKFEGTGGTIEVKQEDSKNDKTKVTVTLIVTPVNGYTMERDNSLEVYAVVPPNGASTRAPEVSGDPLKLDCTDFKDVSQKRTYTVDIDSKLALWVRDVKFKMSGRKDGDDPEPTDPLVGIWYIANETNHSNANINTHWYLVPGADPQQPHYADAYFHNEYCNKSGKGDYTGDNYGDPGKPFLTTYQTNQDLNSIWIVVSTGDGYYNIIHAKTGKYIVYEPPYKDAINRKSMHLESTTTPGDNAKFTITGSLNGPININPKNVTSGNMYFNPATGVGNRAYYYGSSGDYFHDGMIGLYSVSGDKSQWYFEDASTATSLTPVISDVDGSTNTFTITSPAAAFSSIRYTTDGLTTPDASTVNTVVSGSPVTITDTWNVQAVGVFSTFVTPVAGPKELSPVAAPPTINYNNVTGLVTISGVTALSYYYTTNGDTPTIDSTPYNNTPFSVITPTTVKAIAVYVGNVASEVATLPITQVATPTIQDNGNNAVSITCATEGVTIYYTTDGSTPTTSSTEYTGPLTENVSGVTIKAIAVKANMITSEVGSGSVTLACSVPTIVQIGKTVSISCSSPTNATIRYTLDGTNPGGSSTAYSGTPVDISSATLPITIMAYASATGYTASGIETLIITTFGNGTAEAPYLIGSNDFDDFISGVNDDADKAAAYYQIQGDIDASGCAAITRAFTGSLEGTAKADGTFYKISNLSHALFNTINGGTVKNIILDNVNITTGTNVGAIANDVTGTSDHIASIYNCGILSGSVSGSGYVGGLVGQLGSTTANNCYARVINCFSYANVSGGTHAGGIVGYNNYASKSDNIRTMVMNCMMYGNITGGSDIAPIYNGQKITNLGGSKGLNNYNYFSYEDLTATINTYNCALGVEKRSYLQRFEFYRNILNSNRELACWYATGSTDNARQEMAKWVLETADRNNSNPYKYPILKAQGYYPSIVNIDAEHATTGAERKKGGKLGTLTVYIEDGSGAVFSAPSGAGVHTGTLTLNITDKDEDRYNYNYRKVQLPYYNDVGDGNYTDNRVVTGWKITSVTGNSNNTFTKNTTYPEGATDQDIAGIDDCYNFADRTDTGKDLYGTSGRVFAQGAYYDVPDNVTSITIQPYWAKCTYLSDANYDVTYNAGSTATNVTAMGSRPNTVNGGQTVYTSMANALSNLDRNGSHSVYDYAVVFVGNYHHYSGSSSYVGNNYNNNNTNPDLPVTLMSADLDGDNEPDNVFFLQHGKTRIGLCPIRYDFLCVPDIGLAQKADGLTRMPSIGTFWPYGWFETTNTSLMHITQMEYATTKRVVSPLILQGGVFEQTFASWQGGESTSKNRTNYIHLGGNAYFEEFSNGCHLNNTQFTTHVPVSVTGGECKSFYLSGMMLPKNNGTPTEKADNAEGYIDGGKFGEVASGGMQKIDGNVTWIIYNADIDNFYGGGINANKPVTGNISTTMRDCHVTTYCGGPKFGNMSNDKTVTSSISGGTFGTFFGAGYGGTALSKQSTQQDDKFSDTSKWGTWAATYDRKYNSSYGIASRYEFRFFQFSGGSDDTQVGQMYVYYASMSLAETKNVTTTMNGSTVSGNFYGGGSLGKVAGNVNSTLTDCTIKGNVFGAGFSATIPTVEMMNTGATNPDPGYDVNAGVFTEAGYPSSVIYTWKHAGSVSAGSEFDETDGNYILTTENLEKSNLGSVAGNVTLTITGTNGKGSVIGTDGDTTKGNVFGGGESSYVTGAANKVTVNLQGETTVLGSVYGGGDKGVVEGSTEVNIEE